MYFVIIKDEFIFHRPVETLKQMLVLPTKPLTYVKFRKDIKGLLEQLGLGTGYSDIYIRNQSILVTPNVIVIVVKMVN